VARCQGPSVFATDYGPRTRDEFGGLLLTDPGSFLVLANPDAAGTASRDDVWGALWHAAERPWGGTEALDRLFAVGGLAPADRGG
jgi:hypothetical protein